MQLQGRDQKLAVVGGVLLVAWLGWWLWVGPAMEASGMAQARIGRQEKQFGQLLALRARWDSLQARRAALDARITGRGKEFNLTAIMQTAADQAGVASNVKASAPSAPAPLGRYRRQAMEVKLEELTLDNVLAYLYEVDDPKDMVCIDRLEVTPRADNPYYIDLSLTVSTIDAPASAKR